jgi:cytochrome P450
MDLGTVSVADLEDDPYPIYSYLRREYPVAYMPCLDVWMVTRWDDVVTAATDPERVPAEVERSPTDTALGGISMMTTDGEPAKRRRRPFDPTFRPRAVEATMPDVFARLCDERLDRIAEEGQADLVADYFEPISLLSLAHAMGIDDLVDLATLQRWFSGLAAGVSNYEGDPAKTALCDSVSKDIDETLVPCFEAALAAPDDSLISNLAHSFQGTLEERLAWTMPSLKLVLLGGLQEPAHGGATIAYSLLNAPAQHAAVVEDPELVAAAVEEGLRWTAPIGNLLRGVEPGTSLAGVDFPHGARVILVVASANRDREIWGPSADEFDIHRPKRTHLSFAVGPHYCIGHHFARVQLRVAIAKLVARFPRLRLDPDHETVFRGHEYRSPLSVRVLTD